MSNVRAFRHCDDKEDKKPYHYTECGLDNVYLLSGYDIEVDPEYGETVSVKDARALHVAIGIALCQTKKTLSGAELRFLRKEMELTQSRLAGLIGSTAQSVARWEKAVSPQPTAADYLVRLIFLDRVGKPSTGIEHLLDSLKEMDEDGVQQQLFDIDEGDWHLRMAA